MKFDDILENAIGLNASDVHLGVGNPPLARVDGELVAMELGVLTEEDTENFTRLLLSDDKYERLKNDGQLDIAYSYRRSKIFRINIFWYSDKLGLACRMINSTIPTPTELKLPPSIDMVPQLKAGLVLVTGPTGCGKSTTIASIINEINNSKRNHILTLEDPIEYIHESNKCLITQREVGRDCHNFAEALRSALRQDPDVIMVGEMRDLETISTAITAAETGHLVLATLHTRNAYQTIERIIDVFPSNRQQQIRVQLANSLMAVFSQRLLPQKNKAGRIVSVESLIITPAIRNLIRENKIHQLHSFIQTGMKSGMQTMDDYLMDLYKKDEISEDVLLENLTDKDVYRRYSNRIGGSYGT